MIDTVIFFLLGSSLLVKDPFFIINYLFILLMYMCIQNLFFYSDKTCFQRLHLFLYAYDEYIGLRIYQRLIYLFFLYIYVYTEFILLF